MGSSTVAVLWHSANVKLRLAIPECGGDPLKSAVPGIRQAKRYPQPLSGTELVGVKVLRWPQEPWPKSLGKQILCKGCSAGLGPKTPATMSAGGHLHETPAFEQLILSCVGGDRKPDSVSSST